MMPETGMVRFDNREGNKSREFGQVSIAARTEPHLCDKRTTGHHRKRPAVIHVGMQGYRI